MKIKKIYFLFFAILLAGVFLLPHSSLAADTTVIDGITFKNNSNGTLSYNGMTFKYSKGILYYQSNGNSYIAAASSNGAVAYKDSSGNNHIISSNGIDVTASTDSSGNVSYSNNGETYTYDSSTGNATKKDTANNAPPSTNAGQPCTTGGQNGKYDSSGTCNPILTIDNPKKITSGYSGGIVPCGSGNNKSGACTLCDLIVGFKNIISWGSGVLIALSLFGIFVSGVLYIVSSGSEQLTGQAKKFLAASLTGFAIFLMAWLIVNVVMWILAFNVSSIGITGGDSWYKFTCTNTYPTSATPADQTGQKISNPVDYNGD